MTRARVDVWRVFEPRMPPEEGAIGPQPLEVNIRIEHVAALHGAARRTADAQLLAKQVRSAIAEAPAHSLSGPHAAQHDLDAVRALTGFEAFLKSAFTQPIGNVDHRVLTFGPELGDLVGPLSGNEPFTRLEARRAALAPTLALRL